MIAVIFLFLMFGLVVGVVVYELRTGTLVGRGWRIYAYRQDNPTLFWSSIILTMFVALVLAGFCLIAVLGSRDRGPF